MINKLTLYESFIKELAQILNLEPVSLENEDTYSELLQEIKRIKLENRELNSAIDASADSIHITDGEGNIIRVNSTFERDTGTQRQNIIGKNVSDMESENIYAPSIAKLALKEKRKLTMLQKVKIPNSDENSDAITTSIPIFNEDGSVFRVISNARPIKELLLLSEYFKNKPSTPDTHINNFQSSSYFKDNKMKKLIKLAKYIAPVDSSILILGESGTGKSFLARYIHNHSPRKEKKFVEINCAAIPETLMESELFGYETGAFTGAKAGGKRGLIEVADKGTLFLDEIGDMSLAIQSKFLQFIQNRTITRVGGEKPISVDVRIISATNKDLKRLIEEEKFRSDLFYRLNVIPLEVPPLRERKKDIIPLTEFFIEKFNKKYHKSVNFSSTVMNLFIRYEWRGNVRELENLVERLVVINQTGLVTEENLTDTKIPYDDLIEIEEIGSEKISLKETLEKVEERIILNTYNKLQSSYQVAKYLGISQTSANRKIRKYLGRN